ncbi:MAG: hypothetical protein ACT4PK_10505 [Gammaproteobacteria bacterium]
MKNMWGFALLALSLATPAAHAGLGTIEVYDRTAGKTLTVHGFEGRRYVVGEPGHEYQLVLRNGSGGRVLAVTSVDGVNVVTGETADPAQGGYVLGAYDSLAIQGWRKNLDETAAFFFTPHRNSYAARNGRPFDVGVLGVALFREKRVYRPWFEGRAPDEMDDRSADAPSAAPEAQGRRSEQDKLGTGHGRREHNAARYTEFERASDMPDEILTIYYDSRANLVAQGVIPRNKVLAQRRPRPFPGAFVPDP